MHIHQNKKIRRSSNEAICSQRTSSKDGKNERVKRQSYARDDPRVTYYLAAIQKSNRRLKKRFLN